MLGVEVGDGIIFDEGIISEGSIGPLLELAVVGVEADAVLADEVGTTMVGVVTGEVYVAPE